MPKHVHGAKIALLDASLEIEKTETEAQIQITSPNQLQNYLDEEEKILRVMVDKVAASGCNVLSARRA